MYVTAFTYDIHIGLQMYVLLTYLIEFEAQTRVQNTFLFPTIQNGLMNLPTFWAVIT